MGGRRAAGGHRGPRQKVASRLGGTADKVSKEGTPERSAAREPGAMSSPWSSCMETPCPAPARARRLGRAGSFPARPPTR